ncbi:opioid growth factor receptor-related protein [Alphaproteobacteria bacterium]|nr:opioid growth factor receptor-related protein [Alphaproteobacteria bacterium]
MQAEPSILAFLEGVGPDSHGRQLNDIWAFSDTKIEHTHNFIQWLFPLAEPSLSVPGSPTLSDSHITALRRSNVAQSSIVQSSEWYRGFLNRNAHWKTKYDHNHLRITRVIKSIRLIIGDAEANKFHSNVLSLLGGDLSVIDLKAQAFWASA